jgi:hypothetical protein
MEGKEPSLAGTVNGLVDPTSYLTVSDRLTCVAVMDIDIILTKDKVLTLYLSPTVSIDNTTSGEQPTEVEDKG